MAIVYDLSISSLNRKLNLENLNNVIYEAAIGVSARSEEYPQFTYSCSGVVSFEISSIEESSFIPFEQVTKDTIISWILSRENIEKIEDFSYIKYSINNIQDRINALQLQDSVSVNWSITNSLGDDTTISPQPQEVEEQVIVDESVPEEETITEEEQISNESVLEP